MEYNNEYNNGNNKPLTYYIKRFLLGFILIAVFLLAMAWIFPTRSSLENMMNKEEVYSNYFQENLDLLKNVAQSYFTLERLPKNEGDTVKITLDEMLGKKLVHSVNDDKGKSCNVTKTYIEVTKNKTEYEMKINLSCGQDEDYIIVYMGCYDYCSTFICEKKEIKKATTKSVVNKIVNKVVNKKPVTKYYCKVVNGKYYDKKGKIVNKTAYKKSCNGEKPVTKYYCKVVNGKYYDDKGNSVTKTEYQKSCNIIPEKHYRYLYEKEVANIYSDWTDWSANKTYDLDDNITWGKQEYVWNEKTGSKTTTTTKYVADITKPLFIEGSLVKTSLTYKTYACAEYSYYKDATTSTVYRYTSWVYKGKVVMNYMPTNSNTVKYEYVGMDFERCDSTCTLKPYYIFKKYTRTAVSSSTSEATLRAQCDKVVTKTIPVYTKTKQFAGYGVKQVSTTTTTYYYHTKTRTLEQKAATYKIWSNSSNDKTLIEQGYKYIGVKEEI